VRDQETLSDTGAGGFYPQFRKHLSHDDIDGRGRRWKPASWKHILFYKKKMYHGILTQNS
jgi:hypothetical protein